MSEWWPLITAFWAAMLLDCVKIFPSRWRRVFFAAALGRAPRQRIRPERARKRRKFRATAFGQCARAVFSPPLPVAWQGFADDLPFSFSPEGVCNVMVGSVSGEPPEPAVTRSWKWEDIKSVEKKGGRLWVNDRDFCAVTAYAGAAELWALVKNCAALAPDERARFLERRLSGWFRPAHLGRALARVRGRTATVAFFASVNVLMALAVSVYFLADGPELVGARRADYFVRMLPMVGLYAAGVHVATLVAGWLAHRKLAPAQGGQRTSILTSAALLPPLGFRLRAQIAASVLPAQHPLAWFAAVAGEKAFRKRASRVLRDMRWPLAPACCPDPQITRRITQWMRARVLAEAERLLALRRVDADELLAPPEPDGTESRSYCPRCRDQFTKAAGHCSCGIELVALGKRK